MVFSSLLFLFIFLPVFLLLYFILPTRFRNIILLIFSLLFYAWGEPKYIFIMLFSTVLDYTCGLIIDKYRDRPNISRLGLIISLIGNIGLLFVFKYSGFFINTINSAFKSEIKFLELALPIGISFYTFQTMSYTIDLYRGKIKVQKNILNFATYVTMFPQLIAGPIVTYEDISGEINGRTITMNDFGYGVVRFIEGLGKKVLLANNIGMLWDKISNMDIATLSVTNAWLGAIAFGLQIYFDFSGYSDMAIGLGKMLGFSFPENFNHPYISKSATEFWRRWHMTLGSWFRNYVYIPLGGNRVSTMRFLSNIFVVWFLTGFWHGASWNFIVWGLFFAVFLIIEKTFLLKLLEKLPSFISHIYLLFIVIISWVIIAHDSMAQGFNYIKVMLGMTGNSKLDINAMYELRNFTILTIVCIVFSTPLMKRIQTKCPQAIQYLFYLAVLILSTAYLVDSTFNPFLYFRF